MKKEEAKAAREEREQQDQSVQQRSGVEWEQARIDMWRQKLEEREWGVTTRESGVFQRELKYRHLERCPLCRRKERCDNANRQ